MLVKSLYITAPRELSLVEHDLPEPKAHEILYRTKACGICAWDSYQYCGVNVPRTLPYIIGHEGVGIVEKVGSEVRTLRSGDCISVLKGNNEMMCEYAVTTEAHVVKIDTPIKRWEDYVWEPTCCVVNMLEELKIQPGDHVVLVGAGYMGLITLQGMLRASQAGRITVFELRADRRQIAREFGAKEVYDPTDAEGLRIIEQIQSCGGADICIDFSASESGCLLADSMTSQNGKFAIASYHHSPIQFDVTRWHRKGLYVYNPSPYSNAHYLDMVPRTKELILRGAYQPEKLMTHTAYYKNELDLKHLFEISASKDEGYIKGTVLF